MLAGLTNPLSGTLGLGDSARASGGVQGDLGALPPAEVPEQRPVPPPSTETPAAQGQRPKTPYDRFRESLKHPSAQPVSLRLLDFVRNFPRDLPRKEAARRVHRFLGDLQEWMLSEIVAFAAEADEEGRTNTAEGLEKFLLSRLYQKIFATDPKDQEEDAKLQQRIVSFAWVSFDNLGVPPVDASLLDLAGTELKRVDDYKAPFDKLVCILNASRVINDVLKRTLEDAGVAGRPLSADDFLPLLIFCVIKANPPRLHSNLEFVAEFRHPSRLVAEDAYFLTALQSAVAFVKDATPQELDVTETEFASRCAACSASAQEADEVAACEAGSTSTTTEIAGKEGDEAAGKATATREGGAPVAAADPGSHTAAAAVTEPVTPGDAVVPLTSAVASFTESTLSFFGVTRAAQLPVSRKAETEASAPEATGEPAGGERQGEGEGEETRPSSGRRVLPATALAEKVSLSPAQRQQLAAKVQRLSLDFESLESARQLRMDEVPKLLAEYRAMAELLRQVDGGLGEGGSGPQEATWRRRLKALQLPPGAPLAI